MRQLDGCHAAAVADGAGAGAGATAGTAAGRIILILV